MKKELDLAYRELECTHGSPYDKVVSSYNRLKASVQAKPVRTPSQFEGKTRRLRTILRAFETVSKLHILKEREEVARVCQNGVGENEDSEKRVKSFNSLTRLAAEQFKKRNFDKSIALLEEAYAMSPKNSDLMFKLALAMHSAGRNQESLRWLESYEKRAPQSVRGFVLRGHLFRELGRLQEAQTALSQALVLDPENRIAQRALTQIQQQADGIVVYAKERRWARADTEMEVLIKSPVTDGLRRERLCTLGAGGCCLVTNLKLEVGATFPVVLLMGRERQVRTHVEVLYQAPVNKGASAGRAYGVRFVEIESKDQAFIDCFVKAQLKINPKARVA